MTTNLNTKQVMALAGVSHMTVYQWRHGTATKDVLPSHEGNRPGSVEFKPRELKSWAKKHGIELKADPVEVAAGREKLPVKRKPKAAGTKRQKKQTKH